LQYSPELQKEVITPLNKQDQFAHKEYSSTVLKTDEIIVLLGDSPEDFPDFGNHSNFTGYSAGSCYQGFSFTDTEIIPGVVALGKEGSLKRVLEALQ
jgi:hypothetical protein